MQDGERQVTLRRVGDNKAIMVAYHTPGRGAPGQRRRSKCCTALLGDQPSGRLYKALVDNKKAVVARMNHREAHDPGLMQAMVILQVDQSIDEARETLLKTVEGFVNEPPSKEEVERGKARLLKQFDLNLNNSERIGLFLSEYEASGDWRLYFHSRDQIKKVTEQDVVRVAKAYLKESNRTLGEFIPTKTPDRAEVPAAPSVAAVLKDYTGGAAIEQGEVFASDARQYRGPRHPQDAAGRPEAGDAAEEDAGRNGLRAGQSAFRRPGVAL